MTKNGVARNRKTLDADAPLFHVGWSVSWRVAIFYAFGTLILESYEPRDQIIALIPFLLFFVWAKGAVIDIKFLKKQRTVIDTFKLGWSNIWVDTLIRVAIIVPAAVSLPLVGPEPAAGLAAITLVIGELPAEGFATKRALRVVNRQRKNAAPGAS